MWDRNLTSRWGRCLGAMRSGANQQRDKLKTLTAKDAKYGFSQLIDLARSAPVAVSKHGRPVAVEEFARFKALDAPAKVPHPRTEKKERNK
jgi:hypothetical protein